MTSSVTVGPIEKVCPYCNKPGLPILPLRYAVARSDMGNAPRLVAPFGEGVTDIALPEEQAHYTLRLLRSGYLYVYDERYGERGWSAYQVSEGGYLYPFNPYIEAPAGGWKKMNFSCSREGDQAIARCITVEDAPTAKRIWLSFSDVIWTQDVLKQHDDPDYRDTHMRCIDMAKMRDGTDQPHASKLEHLSSRIAEYATNPSMLAAETLPYVNKYLPTPLQNYREILGNSEYAEAARKLWSPMLMRLLTGLVPIQEHGPLEAAAWAFTRAQIFADEILAQDFEQWAASYQMKAGLVALDDPVGIALDLNGLIHQLTAEFTEEPQRKWIQDTASTIEALRHAIKSGIIDEDNRHGNSAIYATSKQEADEIMGRMQDEAWEKYANIMSAPDASDRAISQHRNELEQYEQSKNFEDLEDAYLSWIEADLFNCYFKHNFDTKSLASGAVFCEVLGAILHDMFGRIKVLKYVIRAIFADPTTHDHFIARGFALNNDELIREWVRGAEETQTHDEHSQLANAANTIYIGWAGVITGKDPQAYRGIAKYVYRLSAPILNNIDAAIGKAWLNHLPQKRLMAVLGALAKLDNPKMTLVDLRSAMTLTERANLLNRTIGKVLGNGWGMKTALRRFIRNEVTDMRALVLIDEDKLRAGKAGRLAARTFEEAVIETAPRVGAPVGQAGISVVGFILTAITCKFALQDFKAAGGAELDRQTANLFGQVTSLTGTSFDAASAVLETYNASRLGTPFGAHSLRLVETAKWLTGAARVLGGLGGAICGLVGISQGVSDFKNGHTFLGLAEIFAGSLGIVSGVALLFGLVTLGFIVGILAFIALVAIGYFKQNEVQNWIERSGLGDRRLPPFGGLVEQTLELQRL